MLADVPSPNITDNSFVQPMDFRPEVEIDLSRAKVITIPNNISRGGSGGKGFGVVFDLAQLDRIPEATVQASPIFPVSLKKDVSEARVVVNFIVTTEGTVANAYVEDSTHFGFNEAAVTGVSKWKFRPGMKAGRRVNTRMIVPIIFRLLEGD
jgi:protein TonB